MTTSDWKTGLKPTSINKENGRGKAFPRLLQALRTEALGEGAPTPPLPVVKATPFAFATYHRVTSPRCPVSLLLRDAESPSCYLATQITQWVKGSGRYYLPSSPSILRKRAKCLEKVCFVSSPSRTKRESVLSRLVRLFPQAKRPLPFSAEFLNGRREDPLLLAFSECFPFVKYSEKAHELCCSIGTVCAFRLWACLRS